MADFEIRGADDVDALVKRIGQHADAKALRKDLYAAVNRASKGVRGEMKEAIPASLPRRGGLAATFQRGTRFTTSVKSGQHAGLTIWAKSNKHDIRTLTGRRLRHPVWGNRGVWVDQTEGVQPAVFLASFKYQKPHVQRAILRELNAIAKKVEG